MTPSPDVVVFDVNETLSDMSPLAGSFEDLGAPAGLMQTWFASVLRDGFALTVVGENPAFADIARNLLRVQLPAAGVPVDDLDGAVDRVLGSFGQLQLHPDVVPGLQLLADAGLRLVTLTNGSTSLSRAMFEAAGVSELFEDLLGVDAAGAWKPAPRAYAYAAQQCGTDPGAMLLVAVHPWDIDGAHRAGLRTAWLDRRGSSYPDHFSAPDVTATALDELARMVIDSS